MRYIKEAHSIFNWLRTLQIKQKQIQGKVKGNHLQFTLDHPVEGKKEIKIEYPDSEYFSVKGIGLKIEKRTGDKVFISVYDYGGIFDPIDFCNPGAHYAATHFAFLGALLYEQYKDKMILENIKSAIDFHLRTSKDEYKFKKWGYHWDFKNYAFLETYRIIKKYLREDEQRKWLKGLKEYRENKGNHLTNWYAMRAYSSLLRYKLFHNVVDFLRYLWRIFFVRRAKLPDGCFDDFPHLSRPIQYHVFVLALLHRIYLINSSKRIKDWFLKGVYYFIHFVDPDGCFNYLGRGQEQIFGYGIGLYVLEAAKSINKNQAGYYQYLIDCIWKYLNKFKQNNIFPLVLNYQNDLEKFGWYDYHHLTVYEAFLGVWLALTHKHRFDCNQSVQFKPSEKQLHYLKSSGQVIFSNENYFTVFSRGATEYISEPAITPIHLWFNKVGWFFSCPGGPYSIFGKINRVENIDKNVFAPIVKKRDEKGWYIPALGRAQSIHITDNNLVMVYNYGPFILKRRVTFECNSLIFKDEFEFKANEIFEEIRYFNLPVICDKFTTTIDKNYKLRFESKKGNIHVSLIDSDFELSTFKKGEKIKTAKGLAEVVFLGKESFLSEFGSSKFVTFVMNRG